MASSKNKRKKGGGSGRPAANDPTVVLAELDTILTSLEADPDAGPVWGSLHKALMRAHVDTQTVTGIVMRRDLGALRSTLAELRGEAPAPEPEPAPEVAEAVANVSADDMKKAMRAFRKRLKLTRLDHESKLGVGPMTGGKKADIDAIMAPREFPAEVWEALVVAGQLRRMGPSFYQLTEEG
jgi:hypothetical protein